VDGGHHPVLAPRQSAQHVAGSRLVGRLSEDVVVHEDQSVRREDPVGGVTHGDRGGLLAGETDRRVGPRLAGRDRLDDVGSNDRERDAEVREDLGATRRGGGEDEGRYG
jgi:hypothetical protein